MSGGDGPSTFIFEVDNFTYWKICMEPYCEVDIGVFRTTTQELPKYRDPTNLIGDEIHYNKWNAKTKSILFRRLCKYVFNSARPPNKQQRDI